MPDATGKGGGTVTPGAYGDLGKADRFLNSNLRFELSDGDPMRFTGKILQNVLEYRTVLRALAGTDRVLEINTKSPLASVEMVKWWREEGGRAVSFGSDAHQPYRVGDRFKVAVDIVEQAGFRAGRDQYDFWRA